MNKISSLSECQPARSAITAITLVMIATLLSGCYFVAAQRDYKRPGATTPPWWCAGPPDLMEAECMSFSLHMDLALASANQFPLDGDFAGTELVYTYDGIGTPLAAAVPLASTFDPLAPNVLHYDPTGTPGTSRLVGMSWYIAVPAGSGAPDGFDGTRDVWIPETGLSAYTTNVDDDVYRLSLWAVRGYENHPNIFAAAHPCLTAPVSPLTSTGQACFMASHTVPLEIVVSNDDGIDAEGIDALVEGLFTVVPALDIKIVAPDENHSGSGDTTTAGPETAQGDFTASGRPATSVNGTPADSVQYALRTMLLSPDLVMSGINEGQNLASLGDAVSGTIGAARTAVRGGVPAIASSQGVYKIPPSTENEPADFPAGVTATLALLEQWRLGLMEHMELPNINTPTCLSGLSPQGTVETVVGVDLSSGSYFGIPDCVSAQATFVDDLDAFLNGYISIADMGKNEPPN